MDKGFLWLGALDSSVCERERGGGRGANPVVVLESAPITTPPSNSTAMIEVWRPNGATAEVTILRTRQAGAR